MTLIKERETVQITLKSGENTLSLISQEIRTVREISDLAMCFFKNTSENFLKVSAEGLEYSGIANPDDFAGNAVDILEKHTLQVEGLQEEILGAVQTLAGPLAEVTHS